MVCILAICDVITWPRSITAMPPIKQSIIAIQDVITWPRSITAMPPIKQKPPGINMAHLQETKLGV